MFYAQEGGREGWWVLELLIINFLYLIWPRPPFPLYEFSHIVTLKDSHMAPQWGAMYKIPLGLTTRRAPGPTGSAPRAMGPVAYLEVC